jgi:diacylglycerol kinase family enzyme
VLMVSGTLCSRETSRGILPRVRSFLAPKSLLWRAGALLHMTHIPVILNHRAGVRDVGREEEILAAFASHGISAEIKNVDADGDGDFRSLVRGCVTDRCPVVVVGGGDGSLHAAAGVLAGTDTALGILPVGTLNHFAKNLAVPLGVEDAVAVIVAGVIRNVDVGEANGRVFINNASLGLYPSVVRRREAIQQRLGRSKWLAFAIATRRALLRYRLLLVRVRIKDNDYVRRTPFVFIGNNSYVMDGLNIGTRAVLDAGVLSLYMARRESPFSLLLLALRALLGRLRQAKDFEEFTAKEVRIETRRHHEFVGLDGEVVTMEAPIRCRVRPLALRVVVPAA